MAFGVKWNETGKESDCEPAERRAASPKVRGRRAPGADPAVGCGCGGCTPRPETPSSDSAPDRTGRGGGGRDGAVSHFPLQSKTHRHAPGTPARRGTEPRAPTRAARARPARGPGPRAEKPLARPPAAPRGTAHTHTPSTSSPPLPFPRSSCWPRKSALSRRCWLLTAQHRRLLLRSKTRGGDNQGSVPG